MKKIFFLALILLAAAYSCKKDPGPNDTPANDTIVTDAMARDTLYYLMQDVYYWYKEMPQVNKDNYSNPYKLMDAMRYKPLDRFSFVDDYTAWTNEMSGIVTGIHGIRVGVDQSGKARIAMIYKEAPLYTNGVRRGWIIKSVNGVDIGAALLAGNQAAYSSAFGENKVGVNNTFIFTKPDGTDVTITSAKASFNTTSVLAYDTLHLKNGVAGHIVYESFIQPSLTELGTAFAFFKANNVNSIILDLRYNPGGEIGVAQSLASYIGGPALSGKTFSKIEYNDKLTKYNTPIPFRTMAGAVSVPKMVVITSRGTVSASELIINGLRPFINVVTVGDTTLGKPIGMNVWDVGKKYVFAPITFKIVNSLGQGDYFDGIPPDRLVQDDITHDFSDRREACMKQALDYLNNGTFTAKSVTRFRNSPQYVERPEWMKNMFLFPEKIK